MYTNKAYTIILSAWQATASDALNITNSDNLKAYLEYALYLDVQESRGVYKGQSEISFVVHTNNLAMVQHLGQYVTSLYKQECVLVSHNDMSSVELQSYVIGYGVNVETIGAHFVPTKGDGENYTMLNGNPWSVAA